jgi:hypothetical protein
MWFKFVLQNTGTVEEVGWVEALSEEDAERRARDCGAYAHSDCCGWQWYLIDLADEGVTDFRGVVTDVQREWSSGNQGYVYFLSGLEMGSKEIVESNFPTTIEAIGS